MVFDYQFIIRSDINYEYKLSGEDGWLPFTRSSKPFEYETVFKHQEKEVKVFPKDTRRTEAEAFIRDYFKRIEREEKLASI
jgi:hypothetical protein